MTFLRTLGFVLRAQMNELVQGGHGLSIAGRVILLITALVYAIGFGLVLRFANRLEMNKDAVLLGINITLAAMTFLKSYFPAYQSTTQPIAAFFPMSRLQRSLLGALLDSCSVFPLTVLFFYGVVFAIAFPVLSAPQMLVSLVFFLTALVLDRALRLMLEYNIPKRIGYMTLAVALGVVLFGYNVVEWLKHISPLIIVFPLFVSACAVQGAMALAAVSPHTERVSTVPTRSIGDSTAPQSLISLIFKAFFGSKHVYTLFGTATLVKIGMLLYFWKFRTRNIDDGFERFILHYVLWLYTAPMGMFTYVLNNSFGMNWQMWQSFQHQRGRDVLRLYFLYAAFPLLFDALITLSALLLMRRMQTHLVINYLASTGALLGWGLFVAVRMPIKVEKLTASAWMSFRGINSPVGMWGVLGIFVVISLLSTISVWMPLLLLLPAGLCAVYVMRNFATMKFMTYEKIHQ
ncbi:MAG: hypothetical protein MUF71_02745 [Candidatus Kapabacteria bacterium]|jgi:hypothetical protein|nr:hypothetical protein [Candidatus Kapabacteria bacterium]